jgi:hypothetical protein
MTPPAMRCWPPIRSSPYLFAKVQSDANEPGEREQIEFDRFPILNEFIGHIHVQSFLQPTDSLLIAPRELSESSSEVLDSEGLLGPAPTTDARLAFLMGYTTGRNRGQLPEPLPHRHDVGPTPRVLV